MSCPPTTLIQTQRTPLCKISSTTSLITLIQLMSIHQCSVLDSMAIPQVKLEISAMTAIQRKTTMAILKVVQKTASQAPTQKAGQTAIVKVTPTRIAAPRPIQIQTVMLPRMARRYNWTKKHIQQLQEDRKIVHPKNNTSESTNKR
jgi:hypothetical protein